MMNEELSFIEAVKKITKNHQRNIGDFFSTCHPIAMNYIATKSKFKADEFNIFHVISNLYYRENFHSDIISFLLDPQSNHGLNHLMLKNFIDTLKQLGCVIDETHYHDALVVREEARIDILIKSETSGHAIIIENKMNNATDMHRQLPRYYDYITQHYIVDAIIYLPLSHNKFPDTEDWSQRDKKHVLPLLKILPAYDNMHKVNLTENWLIKSLPSINTTDVATFIRQYANLIIKLNQNYMDTIILERFLQELQQGDNLQTALSIRNMLNDLPSYLALRIQNQFGTTCFPFNKVWIYKSQDAVFENVTIDNIYLKLDIWCYEERYDVLFWCPNQDTEETAFKNIVKQIHSLKEFNPITNEKNKLIRHFSFKEENELFLFIQQLLKELCLLKRT